MNPAGSPLAAPQRQPKAHGSLQSLMLLALLLLLLTALFWWHILSTGERLRQEAQHLTELRAQQVNLALSESTSSLFLNVDSALQGLVDFYASGKPQDFDQKVRVLIKRFPAGSVIQASVIGIDGYARYSNLGLKGRVYLGDREHFKTHLMGDGDRLFISKPLMGRVSRQWSIQFTRPIRQAGRLIGVMVLSISPDYLQHSLAKLTRQSDDIIAILDDSGLALARSRDADHALGLLADQAQALAHLGTGSSGRYSVVSNVDRVERFYYWYRLTDYPVTVLFGVGAQSVMQPVDRVVAEDQFKSGIATVLLWGLALLAFFTSRRMQLQSQKRREFEYAASHDILTGLGNRQALIAHMERLTHAADATPARFAVLFIDLDGFKRVNDSHGHAVGDALLKVVASRIRGCVKSGDVVTRIGGDEFVVITHDAAQPEIGQRSADRIRAALRQPVVIGQVIVGIDASIGLACYPDDGQNTDDLLIAADRAMYAVKSTHKPAGAPASGP